MRLDIYHHFANQHDDKEFHSKLNSIIQKLNTVIMTNEELKALLVDANTKVDKIKAEIQALKDLVANSTGVPQDVVDAVNALGTNLQSTDDLNPNVD